MKQSAASPSDYYTSDDGFTSHPSLDGRVHHEAAAAVAAAASPALSFSCTDALGPEDGPRGLIRSILYAEFDNTRGPVIAHRWPKDWMFPQDDEEADWHDIGLYHSYLIPSDAISGRVCTWSHHAHTFLSCPVTLTSPRYFRNQYKFNLIFCFDVHADIRPFQTVIRKVAQCFQMLEQDIGWLYRQSRTQARAAKLAKAPPGRHRWREGERASVTGVQTAEELLALLAGSNIGIKPEQARRYMGRTGMVTRVWLTEGIVRLQFVDLPDRPEHELPFAAVQRPQDRPAEGPPPTPPDEAPGPPVTPKRVRAATSAAVPEREKDGEAPAGGTGEAPAAAGAPAPVSSGAEAVQGAAVVCRGAGGKPTIAEVLRQMMDGLNTQQECIVDIDESNQLTVKYFPHIPSPKEVNSWDVPILFTCPLREDLAEWDMALRHIVERTDGKRTVASIAMETQMPLSNACHAVRHLVFYGVVDTIDAFQWSNIYELDAACYASWIKEVQGVDGRGVTQAADDAAAFVSREGHAASVEALMCFYRQFGMRSDASTRRRAPPQHLQTVEQVCHEFDRAAQQAQSQEPRGQEAHGHGNDASRRGRRTARRLRECEIEKYNSWRKRTVDSIQDCICPRWAVAYGVLRGLLRRVHEVPIYDSAKAAGAPCEKQALEEGNGALYDMLSQGRCIDDICTQLNVDCMQRYHKGETPEPQQWSRADVMRFDSCFTVYYR
eukprot:TRINITY_DN2612_c0_g2_i1.p2 TRINITY_DN2612_c0_g2~~TRINITY_DN2612_c0_g2_i1.p2  ORF type:complete len:719 (+),score=246.18 TRINITY_DN2612_c0_g2_i1:116-2272(+)